MDWAQIWEIISQPDNVPIVGLAVLVPFYLWYGLRQARATDALMAQLESDPEMAKTHHRKIHPYQPEWGRELQVWPYLLRIEFLAAIIVTVLLIVWSLALNAPLEAPANPNYTMNPDKAPWYFVGLQEILVYFDPWIAGLKGEAPIEVGTIGFDVIQPRLFRQLERSIGERIRLVPAKGLESADRPLRPRELSLVREACTVVRASAREMVQAWRNGAGAEAAVLAGERKARTMAAQDVRTLVSLDAGRTLVPFRGEFKSKTGPLVAYLAVKMTGFWAELFVSRAEHDRPLVPGVRSALDTLTAAMRPGANAAELHAQALRTLESNPLHPVLGASVGRSIGLSLNEGCDLRQDSRHVLQAGKVYAVHVGARDAKAGEIGSAMVAITSKGAEGLCSSEDAFVPGE